MIKSIRCVLIFVLCFLISSCGYKDTSVPKAAVMPQGVTSAVQARDFSSGQLEAHYKKHGSQFGTITIDQYLDQARDLLNAPAGAGVLEKIRDNGDILHYRLSSGEFAVMTPHGRIRTYFKTDMRYWMRQ